MHSAAVFHDDRSLHFYFAAKCRSSAFAFSGHTDSRCRLWWDSHIDSATGFAFMGGPENAKGHQNLPQFRANQTEPVPVWDDVDDIQDSVIVEVPVSLATSVASDLKQ